MPLPKKLPDEHANVDVRRFDTMHTMSTAERLQMADIAYRRGDTKAQSQWKDAAVESAKAEENAQAGQKMRDMLRPLPKPQLGQILEATPAKPFDEASEVQAAARASLVTKSALVEQQVRQQ